MRGARSFDDTCSGDPLTPALVWGFICQAENLHQRDFFIPLFDRSGHPFVPTCRWAERRAQAQSRMPLAAPAEPARSVLDGGEHGATIARKGQYHVDNSYLVKRRASSQDQRRAAQDNQRRTCHDVALVAPQPCIRCGRIVADPPNHDAALRISGEVPRRRAHSLPRHRSHGWGRVTATSDRLGVASRRSEMIAESCVTLLCPFVLLRPTCLQPRSCRRSQFDAGRHLTELHQPPQRDQQLAG